MKNALSFLFVCVALFVTGAESRAADEVSLDYFQSSLDPYGQWVQVGDYGYCWHPASTSADWRPYADGYWAYTDEGWTWVSYEDYGWITYHYGRWVLVDDVGWCWVPGYQWAPAWVSWRSGGDYVGWAPLPPEAGFRTDIGFGASCDTDYDIGPACYNFCEIRLFGSPALRPCILDRTRNVTIIAQTVNVTNITYANGVILSGGPNYRALAGRSERPIPSLRMVRRNEAPGRQGTEPFATRAGDQLVVPSPRAVPPSAPVQPAYATRSFPASKVNRGWTGFNRPVGKENLRATMRQQAAGIPPASASVRANPASQFEAVPRSIPAERPAIVERPVEPIAVAQPRIVPRPERVPEAVGQPVLPVENAVVREPSRVLHPGQRLPEAEQQSYGYSPPPRQTVDEHIVSRPIQNGFAPRQPQSYPVNRQEQPNRPQERQIIQPSIRPEPVIRQQVQAPHVQESRQAPIAVHGDVTGTVSKDVQKTQR